LGELAHTDRLDAVSIGEVDSSLQDPLPLERHPDDLDRIRCSTSLRER
jgi:hypothetical protein